MKKENTLIGKGFRIIALAVILATGIAPLSTALADKGDLQEIGMIEEDPIVNVMLGKAKVVSIDGAVSDVLVANPSIVDVMAVKSNKLYLVGAALGDTNLIVLDAEGNILEQMDVHVQMDTRKLESMIRELYPDETVNVRALTDQLVITGDVSTPSVANRISNMVAQYAAEVQGSDASSVDESITNLLGVRGEQQVMLRVKIVEVARTALKELGLEGEIGDAGESANLGAVAGSLFAATGLGLTAPQQLATAFLSYDAGGFGPLNLFATALEEEGILNTLAEPNLTAISGEQAGFLAGGEFPIPTQLDQNGNLIYEFRPFGVSLNFRPVVLSSNRISMQLTTEVSSATFDEGLQLQGISVPTFNVRRAETTVELPSGSTLMIAGLLQSEAVSGLTQLPGIGDVPVLGDLVKSDSFSRNESEIVVMITPYLVQPFAQNNTAPALPRAEPASHLGALPAAQPAFAGAPLNLPTPEREESKVDKIFEGNMRRTYGSSVPSQLTKDGQNFGYIVE